MGDRSQASVIAFQSREPQPEERTSDAVQSKPFAPPPFDEPVYTINEAAKILKMSPNQARRIFRNEPGVHDLSNDFGRPSRFRRQAQLRIPHTVLARFWRRTEIREREAKQVANGRRF